MSIGCKNLALQENLIPVLPGMRHVLATCNSNNESPKQKHDAMTEFCNN